MKLSWPLETALMTTGLAGDLLGQSRLTSLTPAGPNELRRHDLWTFDRFAAGWYNPWASNISDGVVLVVGGSMVIADGWFSLQHGTWKAALEDGLLLTEALAWSSALSLNTRAFAWHPRPLVYGSDAPQKEREARDAAGSFFSGHTSAAFAGAAYLATVYPLRHPEFTHRGWLWGGSMAAASLVGGLRIAAGKHFLSDVLVGAMVGTVLGVLIPTLHKNPTHSRGTFWLQPIHDGFACQAAWTFSGHKESGLRKVRSASIGSNGREK